MFLSFILAVPLLKWLVLTPFIIVATDSFVPESALAFNANGGGRYQLLVSPQDCRARFESQERYLRRSNFAQVSNTRNRDLQISCPITRTWASDIVGGCDLTFQIEATVRLRPGTSMRPAKLRFGMASITGDHSPAAYQVTTSLTVAAAGWDSVSTYTPGTSMFAEIACIQSTSGTTNINIDEEQFMPSVAITLPPGAQLRGLLASGGDS